MTVYLLHFERPYHHARHYCGFTDQPFEERFLQHLGNGNGRQSPLVRAVIAAGIKVEVAKVWPDGDRRLERRIKHRGNRFYCPLCGAIYLKTTIQSSEGEWSGRELHTAPR